MRHQEIRRLLASRLAGFRRAKLPVTLYPHQEETLDKIAAWLENPDGSRRAYVSHATGLGKTIVFSSLLRFCEGLRALVIVSTKTLVDQTVRQIARFTDGSLCHLSSLPNILDENGDVLARRWKDQAHDVLVSTDDSFKTKRAIERVKAFDPHVIVWDECHWAYTEKARNALSRFPEAVVLAFSATPDFLTNVCKNDYAPVTLDNGQVLYGTPDRFARTHFGDLLDERGARWGIEHGHLAPLAWGRLEFTFSLDGVPTVDGPGGMDYDQSALSKMLARNWPFVIETVGKLYQSGQYDLAKRFSAAICPGVKQAYEIAEALNGIGIAAACITASTPPVERRRILQAGEAGELAFLGSVFALREGWDSPKAEVAMMLRPTKSRVLYLQFMGRVLRKSGDKVALVLDPHYQNARFAPLNAPVLFGKPGQEVHDGGILVGPKNGTTRKAAPPWLTADKLAGLKPILIVEKIDIEYHAGPDGFFEADRETWGTMYALTRRLKLSHNALINRMTDIRSRPGVAPSRSSATFFALSDVEKACADLLEDIPRAGKDGTFEADGETWLTLECAGRTLGLSTGSIERRLGQCRNRPGRSPCGKRVVFYALSGVEKSCADLLEDIPRAGKDGTFEADGETWATLTAYSRLWGMAADTVAKRVLDSGCRSRKGKTPDNQSGTFFALSDVKKACANLLEDLPRAGKDGIFEADGETWASLPALRRIVGVEGDETILSRVKDVRRRIGMNRTRRRIVFYALSDVVKACADLIENLPRAGKDGTFEADGETWGTTSHWADVLGVAQQGVQTRLTACRVLKAKDSGGHIRPFYALSDVERACADLLEKKRRRDKQSQKLKARAVGKKK